MSKGSWFDYRKDGEMIIVKVIIAGGRTEVFKSNKHNYPKLITLLDHKFGFKPTMPHKKEEEKDKDWLSEN